MVDFGIEIELDLPYDDVLDVIIPALKEEGFGILTKIDVKETLKAKLDQDFRQYAILGACNPPLAYQALSNVPEIGLLLPCNITVEAINENRTTVRILDPRIMVNFGNLATNKNLVAVAQEAYSRLARVATTLRSSGN